MSVELARIVGLHGADPVPTATVEQIRDRFAKLGKADPERAHGVEDNMLRAALEAIRNGHPDPVGLARDVLIVADAEFPRWYA
jgi:hypothetical protein